MKKLLSFALLAAAAASPAAAATIFGNPFTPSVMGASFSEAGNGTLADDFSLSSAATIRSAQFWGVHWMNGTPPADSSFTARILADTGSGYGTVVGTSALTMVSRTDTGFDHNNYPGANLLSYVVDFVTPISVSANTSYWFEVVHSASATNDWAWQRSDTNGRRASSGTANDVGNLSFNLRDTFSGAAEVPEPAMLGLFGLGAIGLGLSRRRRA